MKRCKSKLFESYRLRSLLVVVCNVKTEHSVLFVILREQSSPSYDTQVSERDLICINRDNEDVPCHLFDVLQKTKVVVDLFIEEYDLDVAINDGAVGIQLFESFVAMLCIPLMCKAIVGATANCNRQKEKLTFKL